MRALEKLVLAALTQDLAKLVDQEEIRDVQGARPILDLADPQEPDLKALLEQAQGYVAGEARALVRDKPLLSIFSRIKAPAPAVYQPAAPLPATGELAAETFFPKDTPPSVKTKEQLQVLLKELGWLAAEVGLADFEPLYTHLLALLQRYTWCLPGYSQDTSLFDHAKLVSAVAAALYGYQRNPVTGPAGAEPQPFCLLVGDLFGIQDYIFGIANIGAGGVAKRLRARSFYLSILADALSHQVARRFEMPLGNVLMASGGKFYILAANRPGLEDEVGALRREIDGWFREKFNGEIAIHLAAICFAGSQFRAGEPGRPGFGQLVTRLSQQLDREKRRYGQGVLAGADGWDEAAFILKRDFWGVGICPSCGKFPGDQEENLCRQCRQDELVGQKLPHVRYVAYYRDGSGDIKLPLDCSARILARRELDQAGRPYLLLKLNDPHISELARWPGSFRYLANHIPVNKDREPLSFEEIAEDAEGRALLGYIKADMDHLGSLFSLGLRREGPGYDTATHLAALSRSLDLFFSGWMQHTLSQNHPDFYTIFSGGDDLFLVGPWDKAITLACEINDHLAQFVGHNPNISLSAGILFTKDRYPISRAARDADEVLELSKDKGRSRLTLLDTTLPWAEAPLVLKEIEKLKKYSPSQLTSAFLYDLIEYGRLYQLWQVEEKVEGLRYKALFAYNIARNLRKGDKALYQWADQLMQSLSGKSESLTMQYLGLIATYLLFTRRERAGSKEESPAGAGAPEK